MELLHPKIAIPSRYTFSNKICLLLYANVKEALSRQLKMDLPTQLGVAFTTDMWTSRANQGFLSLTIHYIDAEWAMRKWTMDCKMLPGSHHAQAVTRVLNSMIGNIKDLSANTARIMVSDAENKMVRAVKDAEKITHQFTCINHAINLSLKKALDVQEVVSLIQLVKNLATGTHKSTLRNSVMRKKAAALNGKRSFCW